tara:strand:+ start:234 stop:605 length:372 start_codon:yes stop_codon:yes gene_type:complete
MNNVCITGRLVREPELKDVGESQVVNFSIACNRASKEDLSDFFDCFAWGRVAETIGKHFCKGKPIQLVGSLQQDRYTNKEGENRSKVKIKVHTFSFVPTDSTGVGAENTSTATVSVPDDEIPF